MTLTFLSLFVIISVIFLTTYKCTANTVPVVSFQKDGTFSSETYLKRSGKLGDGDSIIDKMTVCLRVKYFYLRGRRTNFLSYGNIDSADALTGYLFDTADVDKFDEPYR